MLASKFDKLKNVDVDQYNQINAICKHVLNAHLDSRKFSTLKQGLASFEEKNGRPMIVEEFVDYARTHFVDRTFVDWLTKYCAEKWPEDA